MKLLIALRLNSFVNKEYNFHKTVDNIYQDMKYGKYLHYRSFIIGFLIGEIVFSFVYNYLIKK